LNIEAKLVKMVELVTGMAVDVNEGAFSKGLFSNLTWAQFIYLDTIGKLNNPTISQVANTLNVARPTVTNTVNSLVSGGFVEKVQTSEDKRIHNIRVTKKGMKIIAAHNQVHRSLAKDLIAPLTAEEVSQLVTLFEKILANYYKTKDEQ